jgi:hypothetical protein
MFLVVAVPMIVVDSSEYSCVNHKDETHCSQIGVCTYKVEHGWSSVSVCVFFLGLKFVEIASSHIQIVVLHHIAGCNSKYIGFPIFELYSSQG